MLGKFMLTFMGLTMGFCNILGSSPLVPDVFEKSPKFITKFTIIHGNIGGQRIGWHWMIMWWIITSVVDMGMGQYYWPSWSHFCLSLPMYMSFLLVTGIILIYPLAPKQLGVALNYSLQLYQQLMKVYDEGPELKEKKKDRILRILKFFVYFIVILAPLYTLFRIIHSCIDPTTIVFFGMGFEDPNIHVGYKIIGVLHNIYVHATILPAFLSTFVTALVFVACGVLMTPFDSIGLGGMRLEKEKFYRITVIDVPLQVTYSKAGGETEETKSPISTDKQASELESVKENVVEVEIDMEVKPKVNVSTVGETYKEMKDQIKENKDNESINQHSV